MNERDEVFRYCADIADNVLKACITDEEREVATTIRNLILARLFSNGQKAWRFVHRTGMADSARISVVDPNSAE